MPKPTPKARAPRRSAEQIARELGPDAQVVTVFADRMERYFSTELFAGLVP